MENQEEKEGSDLFQLYDLKVEVLSGEKPMVCDHQQGEHFFVIGENIVFPEEGRKSFPLYPMAASQMPSALDDPRNRIARSQLDPLRPRSVHDLLFAFG